MVGVKLSAEGIKQGDGKIKDRKEENPQKEAEEENAQKEAEEENAQKEIN